MRCFHWRRDAQCVLEREPAGPIVRLAVGVLDVIPKPMAWRLLEPATKLQPPVRLICREDKADRLLADLAARRTSIVLSDAPIGSGVPMRGFNHLFAESDVSFFATPELVRRYKPGFPRSLNGARCCCQRRTRRSGVRWMCGWTRGGFIRNWLANSTTAP